MTQRERLVLAQGCYFAATGVWPLLHMRSFEMVTGPKVDKWLVRTVGVLVGVVGGVLISAAANRRLSPEIAALGVGTAAGLGAIDTFYASRGRISRIYLADAAIEAAIIGGWAISSHLSEELCLSPARPLLRRRHGHQGNESRLERSETAARWPPR